jgi:hypothetical protein
VKLTIAEDAGVFTLQKWIKFRPPRTWIALAVTYCLRPELKRISVSEGRVVCSIVPATLSGKRMCAAFGVTFPAFASPCTFTVRHDADDVRAVVNYGGPALPLSRDASARLTL